MASNYTFNTYDESLKQQQQQYPPYPGMQQQSQPQYPPYPGQQQQYPPYPSEQPQRYSPYPPVQPQVMRLQMPAAYSPNGIGGADPATGAGGQWGDFSGPGLSEKTARIRFIRKVYSIILVQLIFTFGIVALFVFIPELNKWAKTPAGFALYIVSYVLFFGLIIVFSFCQCCCAQGLRKFPLNFILLAAITVTMAFMLAMISAYHTLQAVLIAVGITFVVVLGVTLFSMQTKFDFTRCWLVGLVLALALLGFGIAIGLCSINSTAFPYLQAVYGGLGALLMALFLAIDTQMVMGNKKYAFSEEDYISGALQIYLDICFMFIFILSAFGGFEKK